MEFGVLLFAFAHRNYNQMQENLSFLINMIKWWSH